MALVWLDRAQETTTTTGTGSLTLGGAVTGFQTFSGVGNGNTCYYALFAVDVFGIPTGVWECGLGTYSTGGTLARTTVHANSSGTQVALSLAAGTKRVILTPTATAYSNNLLASLNLSDLTSASTARTNLGLGTVATLNTVSLTSDVTGTLPVANGGTGLSALGTGLQYLRVNAGATALEYATLASAVTVGTTSVSSGTSGRLLYDNGGTLGETAALTYATSGANLTVTASGPAVVPLVCKGTTSQTANLFEWQNSSGTVGARVTSAVQFSNASVDATTEQFGAGVSMASGVTFSLAVGTVATLATGVSRGVAVGYGASVASGTWYSTVIGYLAQVSVTNDTTGSTAIGAQANVTGAGGTAIGRVATAGVVGTAIGYGTTAAQQAVAIGNLSTATTSAIAIGDAASASSSNSVVIGRSCSAPGGIAMGYQATSSGQGDVAFCTAGDGNNEDARLTMFAASAPLFNNPKRQWRLWGTWVDNSALGYKGRLRGMVCDATNTTGIEAWRIESDGTYGLTSVGGGAVTSSTALTVVSPTATYNAMIIKGATSQSAPLCQLWGVSSTSTNRAQGDIDTAWADSTDATRKARVVLRAWDTAARECVRLEASGSAAMVGLYGTAATAQYATTGTVTGYTGGGGTALTHSDTFTGNTGATAYTIGDVVRALKLLGVMAA